MIDFLMISTRSLKRGSIEIYPKFIVKKSSDLMIRGGDFYAIWNEELGLWSTDEQDAIDLIDKELDRYFEENRHRFEEGAKVAHLWDAETGLIDMWHKYCQRQMIDSYHILDEKIIFSNTDVKKKDYASKKLPYPLEEGSIESYDRLMSTLYSEEERAKIEWAIGAIISGDSKDLQKFMVFYGSVGTGKSTVIHIIEKLFDGYWTSFDAKTLGMQNAAFALEAFRKNPLVAIQHDGDLSRIEDNTRLNSLVSHEVMSVNEKFKSTYDNRFNCFLFMGTNKPVKITDAKSGLMRRLIDVSPSGNKLPQREYNRVVKQINFELGAIAYHCLHVYLENPDKYDDYQPTNMMGASNDFYNFVEDSYFIFSKENKVTLKRAWEMYKTYCDEAKVGYPLSRRPFREELKNYFYDYKSAEETEDGEILRDIFTGFKKSIFDHDLTKSPAEKIQKIILVLDQTESLLDKMLADCQAQYANENETPLNKWDKVKTTLKDIDTKKLHYVKTPENHIVIDFDFKTNGEKSKEKNLEEAAKWPETYAEFSKGGGVHLHYIYDGDVSKLSRVYSEHIEIKVFSGYSSLRRKLTLCNKVPVRHINSGLPLKGDKKVVNFDGLKNEKTIRTMILKNLQKEYHGSTKPSVDFIFKILEDAYNSGIKYDVSDMRSAIFIFAAKSTNHSDYCTKLVSHMKFKSDDEAENVKNDDSLIVFYDVEVFPNLFLTNWKVIGEKKPIIDWINPKPEDIEKLCKYRLIGFNNRRYDNHILYGRMLGYNNAQLFDLSTRIVGKKGDNNAFFRDAYNLSYTDIYDFCSKKQSLKKWEIELGLHHKELGLPWDQPVPKEKWEEVSKYCDNDVIAAEAVFNARQGDWAARQILARLANGSVNDTTNTLSTKLIFGTDKTPQSQFNYRFMGDVPKDNFVVGPIGDIEYTVFTKDGKPVFPGYTFESGKSIYRDEEVGEGGYVYAEPGVYTDIALLDIASMHPSSIIAEELFGKLYTKRFQDIRDARVAIKHHDFDTARGMLDGALVEYINELESGQCWFTADDLAQALKIVINSIYGLTSAKFDNAFKDRRNKDNIVAKRGALFMVNLKHEVQNRGFTVAHIKTDSIKIPNATPEIIEFVMDYGKLYGYIFEHEATYDRMCLVNDAVYIAKYKDGKHAGEWTATGTQFAVPYVFKTLFSHEDITFDDLCETKSVSSAIYVDQNEKLPEGEHNYIFVGKVGRFCPMKDGYGAGLLMRESGVDSEGNKAYAFVTGAKGYRWMESEIVKNLGKEDGIDRSYYDDLVNKAMEAISKYEDFEWFTRN